MAREAVRVRLAARFAVRPSAVEAAPGATPTLADCWSVIETWPMSMTARSVAACW
jgi:hypothetical protein